LRELAFLRCGYDSSSTSFRLVHRLSDIMNAFTKEPVGKLLAWVEPSEGRTVVVCGPGMRWCGFALNADGFDFQASRVLWNGVFHFSAFRRLAKL
jgi:hypothetical protein